MSIRYLLPGQSRYGFFFENPSECRSRIVVCDTKPHKMSLKIDEMIR